MIYTSNDITEEPDAVIPHVRICVVAPGNRCSYHDAEKVTNRRIVVKMLNKKLKSRKIFLVLILVLFMPSLVSGNEIEHDIYTPITTLVPFSNGRPAYPAYQDMMLVGFSDISWIPQSCHQVYVYIDTSDKVLVSVLKCFHGQKGC